MIRCAIYTRKSTEERMDTRFNSIEAQTDACLAYIESQRHADWRCVTERYNDPGFSGGTLERPALQQLLKAVEKREVDIVLVHKVDRLTRSLSDFAKLAELFEYCDVSFVSVTQHLDTSTSMGRLSLSVLLSFAQFEREIASERIKEKIHASRRRGLWTGGSVPLGYRAKNKRLEVDECSAPFVRDLFQRYLALQSVTDLLEEARSKQFGSHFSAAKRSLSRGMLYTLLRNPIYVGKLRCGDELVKGIHEPLVSVEIWQNAQSLLDANGSRRSGNGRTAPAQLLGKIFDERGNRLTRATTKKNTGRTYQYYVSANSTRNQRAKAQYRLPSAKLESFITEELRSFIQSQENRIRWADKFDLPPSEFSTVVSSDAGPLEASALLSCVERLQLNVQTAFLEVSTAKILALLCAQQTEVSKEHRMQISLCHPMLRPKRPQTARSQRAHVANIADGKRWLTLLYTGQAKSMDDIARTHGVSQPTVSRTIARALDQGSNFFRTENA